jgi:lipid-A-disaccharide synthase
VVESGAERGDAAAFRRRHGIADDRKLIVLLPGSRRGEVDRLLPIFARAVEILAAALPRLAIVLPTTETVQARVSEAVARWTLPVTVLRGSAEKYDAFAAADVAIAASGTVALELALAGLPHVVAYRINPLTHALVSRIVKVRFVDLVNLLLGREAVPELGQGKCTPENLAAAALTLIEDAAARAAQIEACAEALRALGYGALSPSLKAADQVLALIDRRT